MPGRYYYCYYYKGVDDTAAAEGHHPHSRMGSSCSAGRARNFDVVNYIPLAAAVGVAGAAAEETVFVSDAASARASSTPREGTSRLSPTNRTAVAAVSGLAS